MTKRIAPAFLALLLAHASPCLANNTAYGTAAGVTMTSGTDNTLIGVQAGTAITTGTDNTLVGYESGIAVTGSHNIILGEDPSSAITSGSSNILIGNSLTGLTAANSNQLNIGNVLTGTGINSPGTSLITLPGALTVTGIITGNLSGNATNVTGTVAAANGGTGQTTIANAFISFFESVATSVGDLVYGGTSGAPTRLAGNTSSTTEFLTSTGTGSVAQAPAWSAPSSLTPAFNGSSITALNGSNISSGTVGASVGGTGADNSASTGVAQWSSGAYSVSTALANGTTATTQTSTDNSTKVATTAFVQSAIGSAPTVNTIVSNSYGFVNKLRNGNFAIAQRGISGTISTSAPAYTLDGWICSATGANASWNQEGPTDYFNQAYYFYLTGATSNTDIKCYQRIESTEAAQLAGNTVTLQCQMQNDTGVSLTPTLSTKYAGSTDSWTSSTTDLSATNLQTIGSSAGTNGLESYTFNVSGSAYTGYEVILDFGAQNSSGKNIIVGSCDLRVTPGVSTGLNSYPPAPEFPPIATELARDQRYFFSTYGNGVAPATATVDGAPITLAFSNVNLVAGYMQFPVGMRVAPTITIYSPSTGASAKMYDETATADVAGALSEGIGTFGANFANGSSLMTGNHLMSFHYTASAEL